MAQLLELKRLKDLKIVGMSSINGNIKIDGTETPIYTHPTTHNADMIVDGTINKAYTSIEKTKLANIKDGATKIETSAINGNIKIDGVESSVYSQPSVGYNEVINRDTCWEIRVTPDNMHNIIYPTDVSSRNGTVDIIFTTQVQAIDEGFTYTIISGTTFLGEIGFKFIKEGSTGQTEFTNCLTAWVNTHYEVTKINGVYKIMQVGGNLSEVANTGEYDHLLNHPFLYDAHSSADADYYSGRTSIRMGNCYTTTKRDSSVFGGGTEAFYDQQTVVGQYNANLESSYFTVGNGEYDNLRSNAFEVYKNGKVGIFNDILIKAGTSLATISQTVQGAINELKGLISTLQNYSMPYITNTVSMDVTVSDITKSISISHTLGYIPKVLVYVESVENSVTFLKQLPVFTYDGLGLTFKVSNNSIVITYDRTNGVPLSIPFTHNFRYRIYKEQL